MGIMASGIQVDLRRQKVKHLLAMGIPAIQMAEQLGVHRHTIERDIAAIKKDIVASMREGLKEDIFLKIETRRGLLEQYYWRLYLEAGTVPVRLSVLKQIQHLLMDWVSIMEKMGVMGEIMTKPWEITENQEKFRRNVLGLSEKWDKEIKGEDEQQIWGKTV